MWVVKISPRTIKHSLNSPSDGVHHYFNNKQLKKKKYEYIFPNHKSREKYFKKKLFFKNTQTLENIIRENASLFTKSRDEEVL